MSDYIQDVHCKQCGTYLFTEEEKDGKWRFKNPPKCEYRYFSIEDMFLCKECGKKYLEGNHG